MTENAEYAEYAENKSRRREGRWRVAAWSTAVFLLLLPLLAMQVTGEVNWTVSDFVFAGVLILGVGIPFELTVRKTRDPAYRAGVGLALAGAFLLFWSSGAVGITDSEAEGLYFLALAVGLVGAFVARFRPLGLSRAMFTAAFAFVAAGVIALLSGVVPAHNSALKILGITGLFAAVFAGSALLFWEAARRGREGRVV